MSYLKPCSFRAPAAPAHHSKAFDQVFTSELLDLLRRSVPPGDGDWWILVAGGLKQKLPPTFAFRAEGLGHVWKCHKTCQHVA